MGRKIDFKNYLSSDMFWNEEEIMEQFGQSYELLFPNSLLIKNLDLFNRYKNENLIKKKTPNGEISLSKDLLMDLLSDDALYSYMLSNIDNMLEEVISLIFFQNGKFIDNIKVSRADVAAFYQDLKLRDYILQMRIALINQVTNISACKTKYNNVIHKCTIDGKEYQINALTLLDLLSSDDDEFNLFVIGKKDEYYGYPKEYIAYMIIDFIEKERLFYKYVFPDVMIKRVEELGSYKLIDYESLNKMQKSNDAFGENIIDKVTINKNLYKAIFYKCPKEYSPLEKAMCAYIKMCELLSFNHEYYAASTGFQKSSLHHVLEHLVTIDLENNKIIGEEFIFIYAKILNNLNICYTINYSDNNVISLDAQYGEYLFKIDDSEDGVRSDLSKAKTPEQLRGLICKNTEKTSNYKFRNIYEKVTDYIKDISKKEAFYKSNLEMYSRMHDKSSLSIKDRLSILLKIVGSANLYGLDTIFYIKTVFTKLFIEDEGVSINFISSSKNNQDSLSYKTIIIISILIDGVYEYYIIDPKIFDKIESISREELINKFEHHKFAYINKEDSIKGLDLQKGDNYVR